MRITDLSHQIHTGMTVFPGDPSVKINPTLSIETEGVAVSRLTMGSHTGTHIDAPSHTISGGRTMAEVGLEEVVGPGLLVRLLGLEPNTEITEEMLVDLLPERLPPIVVISTGWDRYWGQSRYVDHPFLSVSAIRLCSAKGMKLLGIDWLNPDRTFKEPSANSEPDFDLLAPTLPVHEEILGRDGLIVENLCHLDHLLGDKAGGSRRSVEIDEFVFAPLRLDGVDGSPVRAFAKTVHHE